MRAKPLAQLPNCEQEQPLDVAFLYYDLNLYLSYECARDFLSAPKNYALIRLSQRVAQDVNLSPMQYDCFDYDESGQCVQRGCFVLEGDDDEKIFYLSGLGFSLAVCYQELELLQRIYQVVDAQQALLEYVPTI